MVQVVRQSLTAWLLSLSMLVVSHSVQAVQPEPLPTNDDSYSLAEIRAAYLISVMRYVNWPNEEQRSELTIGVLGDENVFELLASIPLGEMRDKPIQVQLLTRNSQVAQVDLVYVGPRHSGASELILNQAMRNNVLVITEDRLVRQNMMINISADNAGAISYQINDQRINSAGLEVNSGLLQISGQELNTLAAHHRSMLEIASIQSSRQELSEQNNLLREELRQLQERISSLEQALSERDQVLRVQEGTIEEKQEVMDSQQATLNNLLSELEQQRELLFNREEQLNRIQNLLDDSERTLREQERLLETKEAQLAAKEQEGNELAQRITANRDILAAQQQQLRDQRSALTEQAALIENRERTIDRQREYLIYILIALAAASILGVLSLSLYVKKRRTATQLMDALTELHNAQDKLVESEKMAALGNLVAGVAHEVNTPLGVALTATSMLNDRREILQQNVREGRLTREQLDRFLGQSEESLSLTEKNLSRVARLISNFKQVAVDQMVTERRTIDLGNYIEEIMSALSIELKRAHIDFQIDVDGEIEMDTIPGAMAQILTNLVTNSIRHGYAATSTQEAGDSDIRGTITIRAARADADYVRLSFCDDGNGMDDATLQKIFEPFFTTKRNQGGTGLGMPIVYNLVRQQLKGDITVSSTPGQGTCFELLLPRRVRIN
ncbi:hypothetical protein CWE12_11555 [Aliidiomarina sedimenti]|uniref:histidine kinase n=1 Tax=Aliidiomarina sedimenti TaxID=1933879 RepID=A0ABY0BXF4_9GAMM|nr:hypothetical protein CWE12_11555 [Aliidiomarina sedimenti]